MTWPATLAPDTRGAPTVTLSPSVTIRTSPKDTLPLASPASFSTTILSPLATRYCLPPVLMIANMPGRRKVRRIAQRKALGGGGRYRRRARQRSTRRGPRDGAEPVTYGPFLVSAAGAYFRPGRPGPGG